MNHRAIVAKQLNEELVTLRARLAVVEAGILALGGTVANVDAPAKTRRNRSAGKAGTASATTAVRAPRVRNRAGNAGDPPELIAQLKAISEDESLHGIQKAQASRKARAAFKRGDVTPVREGAILSEAASAELS